MDWGSTGHSTGPLPSIPDLSPHLLPSPFYPLFHPHPFNSCLLSVLILMSLITFPAFSLSAFLQGPLCLVSSEPTVCFRVLGHCTCLSAPRMPSPTISYLAALLAPFPPQSLPSPAQVYVAGCIPHLPRGAEVNVPGWCGPRGSDFP